MVAFHAHPVALVLVGREHHFEVPVRVYLEIVHQAVGRGHDSVHRLQSDVPRGAPVAEEPIRFAAPQRRPHVNAVRTLHAPRQNVVGARTGYGQHRIGIDPQRLVDADGQQHHQVPHPRGVVDTVAVDVTRRDEFACGLQPIEEVRPGHGQVSGAATVAGQRRLGDGERQPGHRIRVRHISLQSSHPLLTENRCFHCRTL